MSSSIATANATAPVSTMTATGANSGISNLTGSRPPATAATAAAVPTIPPMVAQFREIHKNTWLKRLTAEGKKVVVGPKKSERSWVVFCVHDDTEAMLEGYAEPRQAPSHNPEWMVSMQDTLHISHALIPNSHEFEFVVTLSNEVVRFHAMSWDIMQEWVETLRSKLREMKILSPRENLYTKLPEVRLPLLPTRDPTSPLPAPPPVPAAIVPGVERVIPPSIQQQQSDDNSTSDTRGIAEGSAPSSSMVTNDGSLNNNATETESTSTSATITTTSAGGATQALVNTITTTTTPLLTSMSNTLTQNLLNMLSDPISAYSEQLNDANSSSSSIELDDDRPIAATTMSLAAEKDFNLSDSQSTEDEYIGPLLRKPSVNNTSDLATFASSSNSVRLDILAAHRTSADQIRNLENILQCERRIPRPHTSRSLSAGAVDKPKLHTNVHLKSEEDSNTSPSTVLENTSSRGNNITELEINSDFEIAQTVTAAGGKSTATAASTSDNTKTNITIIQVSTDITKGDNTSKRDGDDNVPPTIPQKSKNTEIFTFPDMQFAVAASSAALARNTSKQQHEYKSNVQIIPSSSNNSSSSNPHHNSSTIQVIATNSARGVVANQYTTPVKKSLGTVASSTTTASDELSKITTVHVAGSDNAYGTCFTPPSSATAMSASSNTSTPKLPKKIILSANTSGITNISVNSNNDETAVALRNNTSLKEMEKSVNFNRSNSLHYEKVFLSSTLTCTPINASDADVSSAAPSTSQHQNGPTPMSPKWNSPLRQVNQNKLRVDTGPLSPTPQSTVANGVDKKQRQPGSKQINGKASPSQAGLDHSRAGTQKMGSPAMQRRRIVSPCAAQSTAQNQRHPFLLTRGLTEAVITTRPSRRDFHFLNKLSTNKSKLPHQSSSSSSFVNTNSKSSANNSNNNGDAASGPSSSTQTPTHIAINRTTSDAIEQRRRSSSTSDAQAQRNSRGANNNEFSMRANSGAGSGALRQPPQPFRPSDSLLSGGQNALHNSSTTSPAKRMTLREQQVMQLRREIMHPGGVRLQLRRKDCVGSIAWVDAFGAVWVAGWKQKEHPVLYNALHIGDQLLSIAGVTISSSAEANKIIRNTNTLFVEVLVRRIPFGRGYAIRRDREGQCLGLIRDGNTATIVDVVPNSLAARHGLPPKAQSCDGTTLTFWVLTEINGRPLNLFFKDNEIRDRLNSVGRDISILVQPSDLITKLKKQLKSLRGYKDYLVQ